MLGIFSKSYIAQQKKKKDSKFLLPLTCIFVLFSLQFQTETILLHISNYQVIYSMVGWLFSCVFINATNKTFLLKMGSRKTAKQHK